MSEFHDKGYRLLFSFPEMVKDLILHFVRADWLDLLDFSTLEKVSERDLSSKLARREKDLLWRLRWYPPGLSDGEWLYVFIHLEFQSSIDRFMALRHVTYKVLLYEDLIRREHLPPDGKLPPVLSITIYNGKAVWDAAQSLEDLVQPLPGQTAAQSVLSYTLIDERRYSQEILDETPGPSSVLFQLEKSQSVDELRIAVNRLVKEFEGTERSELRNAFKVWLDKVLLPAREKSAKGLKEIQDLTEVKTMLEQTVVEWTQEWKQEGRTEGRAEGRLEVLKSLLENRFGPVSEATKQRLSEADPDQLLTWAARVLKAESLEDVFRD